MFLSVHHVGRSFEAELAIMPAEDAGPHDDDSQSSLRPPRWRWDQLLQFINLDDQIECFDPSGAEGPWVGRCFPDQERDDASEREFVYLARKPRSKAIQRKRTTEQDQKERWTEFQLHRPRSYRRRTTKRKDEDRFGVLKDQCVWRITGDRFVLLILEYSGTGPEGEPAAPLLGRELSHKDASLWFALQEIKPPPPLVALVPNPDPSLDPKSRLNRDWQPESVAPPEGGSAVTVTTTEAKATGLDPAQSDHPEEPANRSAHASTRKRVASELEKPAKTLTPNDFKLLRTMRTLTAIDPEHAASRKRITAEARTGNVDSKHNQESFERLKSNALIDAARRVGTWLTAKGLALLVRENRE
jgi:hypothetical protein